MGTLAILGTPPFGVFASEFLILTTAMKQQPWATPILLLALGVAFAAIFGRVQSMVFGDTSAKRLPHPPALLPVFAHLGSGARAGYFYPALSRGLVSRRGALDRRGMRWLCNAGSTRRPSSPRRTGGSDRRRSETLWPPRHSARNGVKPPKTWRPMAVGYFAMGQPRRHRRGRCPSRIYCQLWRARTELARGGIRCTLSWDRAMVSECKPYATRR